MSETKSGISRRYLLKGAALSAAGVAAPAEQAARVPARDVAARERAKVRCNFILSSSSFVFQGHRYDTG